MTQCTAMAPREELFRAAVVTGPGAGFLLSGGAAKSASTTVHRISGGQSVEQWTVPYVLHAACAINRPAVGIVAIGPPDRFVVFNAQGLREGRVYKQCTPPTVRKMEGALTGLGTIDERAWVVGLDGIAWRLDSDDQWTTFEDAQTTDQKWTCVSGAGVPVVAGPGGAVFSIGRKWKRLPDAPLATPVAMSFDASGRCTLAGQDAEGAPSVCVLERGRWKTLAWAEEERPAALSDVTWFKGQLYVSGSEGLLQLEKDRLAILPLTRGVSTGKLASGAELWSIGERDVLRFDGRDWKTITFPAAKKA